MKKVTLLFSALFILGFMSVKSIAQISIDGLISEAEYQLIGAKQNTNDGFGSAIDVSQIYYSVSSGVLYLGIVSKLDVTNSDELGVWLNVTSRNGDLAGTGLGGIGSTSSFFSDVNNPNYKADFEVDYQFAFNPGAGTTNVYFDAANNWGTKSAQYIGTTDQSGTSTVGPSTTGVFTANSITWAYNNSGASNTGLEIGIPFSELGATSADNINVFAFIISTDAYFSNVTVPGNISSVNLGYNADFSILSGGPFHTNLADGSLPVELTSFVALAGNSKVTLQWVTQSEINNQGFIITRAYRQNGDYQPIANYKNNASLKGSGTSSTKHVYSYSDQNVLNDVTYWYKLIDVNINGVRTEHAAVSATPQANNANLIMVNNGNRPQQFALHQNYPNPFNPSTRIRFDIPQLSDGAANVRLSIFDVTGKKVVDLLHTQLGAGVYEANWNGKNIQGVNLPSGIYFSVLQSKNYRATRKLMLVR